MFRKEGLEEIRVDIERATCIDALRGIATAMHATTVHAAEEITQLKAELAAEKGARKRTERIIKEATQDMAIEASYYIVQYPKNTGNAIIVGNKGTHPDLYAHLAGREG